MLTSLLIKNYAIIESVELHLNDGLIIITGETGAGKSIIVGALQLIMGKRADLKVLYDKNKKCIVEGVFNIKDDNLQATFAEYDLEYDDELIIRREISASGKSRAFINDTPTNLSVLAKVSSRLIDLHQQFDTLEIHEASHQIDVVDTMAGTHKQLAKYKSLYSKYQSCRKDLEEAERKIAEGEKELDYIKFQLEEFDTIELTAGEQEPLEQEMSTLENAEEIETILSQIVHRISESDQNLLDELQDQVKSLIQISKYNPELSSLSDRLIATREELQDIANDLEGINEQTEHNPEKLTEISQRLDVIYRLQRKHQVQSVDELIDIKEGLSKNYAAYADSDNYISNLKTELADSLAGATAEAAKISAKRQKIVPTVEKKIKAFLKELAMPHASLKIDLQPAKELSVYGMDKIEFLFSANQGSTPMPLKKVASGGELSRLNLSLKNLVADQMNLPTLIFDEIDIGISGEVAQRMGSILSDLGSKHQVIVITHSPQVASNADTHLLVYKRTANNSTHTAIKSLEHTDRVQEIAKMLSGDPPTKSAILNAEELINHT